MHMFKVAITTLEFFVKSQSSHCDGFTGVYMSECTELYTLNMFN